MVFHIHPFDWTETKEKCSILDRAVSHKGVSTEFGKIKEKAVCATLLMDFAVLISVCLYLRSGSKCTVPLTSGHVCSIRVLVRVLGDVVRRVWSCTRDGENDMDSSMSCHKLNSFFKSIFNCMGNSACHSFVFVCPVSSLQRLVTRNTFNLYLAENKKLHTGLPLEFNGTTKQKRNRLLLIKLV